MAEEKNTIGFAVDVTTGRSEENLEGVIEKINSVKTEIGNLKKQTKDADDIKLAQLNASIESLQRQLTKLNAVYSSWIQNATHIDTKPIGNVKKQLQELADILTKWDGQAATFGKEVASRFLIPNAAIDQAKLYQTIMQQIQGLARNGDVGQFKATQAIDYFNTRLVNAQKQADLLSQKINSLKKTASQLDAAQGFKNWMNAGGGDFLSAGMFDVWTGRFDERIKRLKAINQELQSLTKEQVGFKGSDSEFEGLRSNAMASVTDEVVYLKRQLDALNASYKGVSQTAKQSAQDMVRAWKGQGSFVESLGDLGSYTKAIREYRDLRSQLKYALDNSTISDKTTLDLYKKALDELNDAIRRAKASLRGEDEPKQQTKTVVQRTPKQSYTDAFNKWSGEGKFTDQFDFGSWSNAVTQLKKMRSELDYAFAKSSDTSSLEKYKLAINQITMALQEAEAEQSKWNTKKTQVTPSIDVDVQKTERAVSSYMQMQRELDSIKERIKSNYIANYGKDMDAYGKNLAPLVERYKELSKAINGAERNMQSIAFKADIIGNSFDRLKHRASWIMANFGANTFFSGVNAWFDAQRQVEQSMAQFAQVMPHGIPLVQGDSDLAVSARELAQRLGASDIAVNAFGKSLHELDFSDLKNGMHESVVGSDAFRKQLDGMQDSLMKLSVKYGEANEHVIQSATLWGRMYKDNNIVLTMTDAAMKLAVADSFSVVEANKNLESSIQQWGFEIKNNNDAMTVSSKIIDSWTALAHNMAVSANDLSAANQRAASSMHAAGIEFDVGQALIATMLRNTQQAGGEIGNAMKSIIGSIHSDKAIKEIESLGIAMYQTGQNGQREFRNVGQVLVDLMIKTQGTKENLEDLLKDISGGKHSHLPQPSAMAA